MLIKKRGHKGLQIHIVVNKITVQGGGTGSAAATGHTFEIPVAGDVKFQLIHTTVATQVITAQVFFDER